MKVFMNCFHSLDVLWGIWRSELKTRLTVILVAQLVPSPSQTWHSSRTPLLQQIPFSSRTVVQHVLCESMDLQAQNEQTLHKFHTTKCNMQVTLFANASRLGGNSTFINKVEIEPTNVNQQDIYFLQLDARSLSLALFWGAYFTWSTLRKCGHREQIISSLLVSYK